MRGASVFLLCVFVVGCEPDHVAEVKGEIEKLKAERVEASVVSQAHSEADAAEKRLAETKATLDQLRKEAVGLGARKKELESALAREAELTEHLRTDTATAQQATAAEQAESEKKDGEIALARSKAMGVREQAAVLAREIRPGDPAWATERRVRAVTEFIAKVAHAYPDDPVVAELAQREDVEDPVEAGALAAQKVARLRDRFTRVYNLDAPDVAAGEKAPAPSN
jgi:hypothetical protein